MSTLFDHLALVIGRDAIDLLVERFGGSDVRVPVSVESSSLMAAELCATLGASRYSQLVRTYAGEVLYIPRESNRMREQMIAQAIALAAEGMPSVEIMRRLHRPDGSHPTFRWVTRTLAEARADGRLVAARPARRIRSRVVLPFDPDRIPAAQEADHG